MSSLPLVSIIIPVYNGENYLDQAIESALNQTYPYIEIIVIDDGSTDKTAQIALSYKDKIRYFYKSNGGVSSALNVGIEQMKGAFLSWLSHDDLYCPQKIARQIEESQQYPSNTLFWSDFEVIDENRKIIDSFILFNENKKSDTFQILSTFIHGCSLLIPKQGINEVGLFNESLKTVQDNEMWIRFVKAGYHFIHLSEKLIYSRRHSKQGQVTMSDLNREESRKFYQWAINYLGKEIALTHEELQKIVSKKGLSLEL